MGDHGKLGHGNVEDQLSLCPIHSLRGVVISEVAAGTHHTLTLSNAGTVYSFGRGENGRLGHGDECDLYCPRAIDALAGERIHAVAAGAHQSLALSEKGVLFSFGFGFAGRLGHGDETDCPTPRAIQAFARVRIQAIAAGDYHSVVLSDEGLVYSFGRGEHGVLGHGDSANQLLPRVVERLRGRHVGVIGAGCKDTFAGFAEKGAPSFRWGGKVPISSASCLPTTIPLLALKCHSS